ncbi:MAG TPA: EamA/RhaT family transporter [Gammaproteobacteria bacterium]|nr:EamA/RhaT family transporter [Gammaproteobacteria bacterium]
MQYILLSVLCSVAVSVLLKLAKRYAVDINQAIVINYLVAAVVTAGWFNPRPASLLQSDAHAAWPVLLALGVLLPSIFAVLALAVRRAGVVRADAAQRLSLLLPLIAAFTVFGEPFSWLKGVGIAIGLAAIACLVARRDNGTGGHGHAGTGWLWLILVFAGMGAIDILFKEVAQLVNVSFPTVLLATFVLAFVLSGVAIAALYLSGRARLRSRHVVAGVVLGLLNFGNIVFYIEAHRALPRNPATVFSAMNIGVIAVAALVGVLLFRERLNKWNRAGVVLAIAAVAVIAAA